MSLRLPWATVQAFTDVHLATSSNTQGFPRKLVSNHCLVSLFTAAFELQTVTSVKLLGPSSWLLPFQCLLSGLQGGTFWIWGWLQSAFLQVVGMDFNSSPQGTLPSC